MFSAIQRLLVKSGHNFSVLIECSIQIFHAADNNAFKLGAIKPYSAAEFEYGGTDANCGFGLCVQNNFADRFAVKVSFHILGGERVDRERTEKEQAGSKFHCISMITILGQMDLRECAWGFWGQGIF